MPNKYRHKLEAVGLVCSGSSPDSRLVEFVEPPHTLAGECLPEDPGQLRADEAIQAADTLLLTVPNQLGVEYNAHVIANILTHVAPALGWR